MRAACINAYTLTCAAGVGMPAVNRSLKEARTGLSETPWPGCGVATWLGRVAALDDDERHVDERWGCRNNRLAQLGLEQDGFATRVREAVAHYGAGRCAVILGTSTSSIGRTEQAYSELQPDQRFSPEFRQPEVHNPHSVSGYVAEYLGITGPAMTLSTACSSSAKVFASAARWLACNVADAIVVGGVDSLCLSVIYGFHSLQLVSPNPCRPFDRDREGISLGEAAGFALVSRDPFGANSLALLGYGESTDAYHMSSAHPEGLGAQLAMQAAIKRSGLSFEGIDYLNLHGTGTRSNDGIEGRLCASLFPESTLLSATKGWTGHTLGAAGITEAVLSINALATGFVPGTLNTRSPDPACEAPILLDGVEAPIDTAMSNSFGFGGNNCSLIFGRA
ncbi:MAG: beta-ketoacyl-ACP synthase [Gammaproteobacteria bacterium]|nr:beta-ketoacyl-ACP synthase [Gammaproteobacteria bacterium]